MSNEPITLAEVCDQATAEGTYINVPFDVIVRNATSGKGRVPSKADLTDPTNTRTKAKGAYFGGNFLDYNGSVIRMAGKGIKAKLYNGEVEISINDKTSVVVIGDAPAAGAARAGQPPDSQPAATPGHAPDTRTPPAAKPIENPEAEFHKGMKKTALLYLHAYQYACDLQVKTGNKLTPDHFQAACASIFIAADRNGALRAPIPGPRAVDGVGFMAYVAPKPDMKAAEEAARLAAEAAAAEAARKAKEEHAKRAKEELDEDVPF